MEGTTILCMLLIFPFFAISQNNRITTEPDTLIKRAIYYREKERDPQKALDIAKQALERAKQQNDPLATGNSNLQIGLAFKILEKPDSAFLYYQDALYVFSSLPNRERMASVYNNLASLKETTGEYIEALKYARLGTEYWSVDTISNAGNLARIYNNTANIFDELLRGDSAIYYNQKAVGIIKGTNSEDEFREILADAEYGLGNRYGNRGRMGAVYSAL